MRAKSLELALLSLLACGLAAGIPLSTGYFGWSWDALNHHVYLGFIAESPRWDLDVIPASYQSYQYPYLYWPVYRLSLLDGRGAVVGSVWTAFQALMVLWPLWNIADRLVPHAGSRAAGIAERVAACAIAFMSAVVLIGIETTGNDVLATVPFLWALAISLKPPFDAKQAALAAGLWGVATAFKLSNGLLLPWLLVWWWMPGRRAWNWQRAAALLGGAALGFCLTYLPWGWQLWQVTGNPFHPYFAAYFGGR